MVSIIENEGFEGVYTETSSCGFMLHIFFINGNIVKDEIKLREIIKYLLVQAFCKEYFNIYAEESYLLLAMLQFTKCQIKNKYYPAYENSKLFNIVKRVDSFDELQLILALNYKI